MAERRKLGQILVDAGVITPEQLRVVLEDQKHYGGKLGTLLLERRWITERIFFQALSSQLKIPAIDFTQSTIPESVLGLLPKDMIERHLIMPVATKRTPSGNVLVVAMADPTNVAVQDEVRFKTGLRVEPVLALESTLRNAIREYFYELNGVGSYRMKTVDMEQESPTEMEIMREIERFEKSEDAKTVKGSADAVKEIPISEILEPDSDRPQLSRELKALLKILAKKGIITQKEYMDAFKETT